jgi:hypothetical protein
VEHDIVWQNALAHVNKTVSEVMEAYRNNKGVREHFHQVFTEKNYLRKLLVTAKKLRSWMCRVLLEGEEESFEEFISLLAPYYDGQPIYAFHPIAAILDGEPSEKDLCAQEAYFLLLSFRRISDTPSGGFAYAFYAYMLFQTWFKRFLSQQTNQWGFDQFQKITNNDARSTSEKSYRHLYEQLGGHYGEDVTFVGGRFSPKASVAAGRNLLKKKIIDPHLQYIKEKKRAGRRAVELKLTAHLIKEADGNVVKLRKWMHNNGSTADKPFLLNRCRHQKLRQINNRKLRLLIHIAKNDEEIGNYVVGLDAAANELETPPEVFAPAYRRFRRSGYKHFTYHAGEDFIHLISGIRAIYEASEFLGLSTGDRIGHATAIGIDPKLWHKRAGKKAWINRQEWLDNLVFAAHVFRNSPKHTQLAHKIDHEICGIYEQIYNKAPSPNAVYGGWKMRKIDPLIALDPELELCNATPGNLRHTFSKTSSNYFMDVNDGKEWELIGKNINKHGASAFEYFCDYHNPENYVGAETLININSDLFSMESLKHLQQWVTIKLNEKGIAVESMPTSNVRISYYEGHSEHHLPRWLGVDKHFEGETHPTVVLGSDDPGIFDTNIRNEVTHVFEMLTNPPFSLDSDKAMELVRMLNRNSKNYRFTL